MFDIIGKRFWYFLISGIVILAGIIALFVFGLQPGIEFKSGSDLTIAFQQPPDKQQVEKALADLGYSRGSTLVSQSDTNFIITVPELKTDADKSVLLDGLAAKLGEFKSGQIQTVGSAAAENMTRNVIIAVIISAIGMLLYISWAFRRMPNPFRWGTCAIASLVHDVLVVVGVFALLSGIFGWQVDLMFIAGVLTVIGYSVNDTIVIFDRIRENVRNYGDSDFEGVVNYSLVETMSRTLITGIGTLFVLIALLLVI
ncbi:MAG: protein translocase subunit SecF, partial [Dehalococcoidales bacterium]|nr:protein translocase subunit SecF [Dehalococcoidales bacterium]